MSDLTRESELQLAELRGRVDEITTQLKKPPGKKSPLDILAALAPLISGVLLAGVGTAATIVYDNWQTRLKHFELLDKFRPYVTSGNSVERVFGYRAFVRLGEQNFVVELIEAGNDIAGVNVLTDIGGQGTDAASRRAVSVGNEIMASAVSVEQREPPVPILAVRQGAAEEGWAYLGQYLKESKQWQTRYFDIPAGADPKSLEGKSFRVREQTGSLNVRVGMPTATGRFLKVKDALKPLSEATILETDEWYTTGYMWARISYRK